MDADPPALLWTHKIAIRSKAEVLKEDWKADDVETGSNKRYERYATPAPADVTTWTTLKARALTLFYQAPSSPPIPSMKEIHGIGSAKWEMLLSNVALAQTLWK
jgi:hypothetical protein